MKPQRCLIVLGAIWLAWIDLCNGLTILLEDGNQAPDSVNVIENTRFELNCDEGSVLQQRIVWRKIEDESFAILNANLTFSNIQKVHAGTYECQDEINILMETVTVRILYPPGLPSISGPTELLKDSTITLTCTADAVPEPTFSWTDYTDSLVLARGNQYIGTVGSYSWLTCRAENTMFPTIGESVTTAQSQDVYITSLKPANIYLDDSYSFDVGSDVIVHCLVFGEPDPTVWWTRDNDPTFRFDGEILHIQNVDLDFSGSYTCHAENTLAPSGQQEQNITVSKTTLITITDPGIPDECRGQSQVLVDEALDTCMCNNVTNGNDCDSNYQIGLIAAAVVGWSLAFILTAVFLICCIRRRGKKQKGTADQHDTRVESTTPGIKSARPRLLSHERPANRTVLPDKPVTEGRNGGDSYKYVRVRAERQKIIWNQFLPKTNTSIFISNLVKQPGRTHNRVATKTMARVDTMTTKENDDFKVSAIRNPTSTTTSLCTD